MAKWDPWPTDAWQSAAMDYPAHFGRETVAFEAAARRAAAGGDAPLIPSCPDWTMSDLVLHLGGVHRYVARILCRRA